LDGGGLPSLAKSPFGIEVHLHYPSVSSKEGIETFLDQCLPSLYHFRIALIPCIISYIIPYTLQEGMGILVANMRG
jgi:hypothetical protein